MCYPRDFTVLLLAAVFTVGCSDDKTESTDSSHTGYDAANGERVALIEKPRLVTSSDKDMALVEVVVPEGFAWEEEIDELSAIIAVPDLDDLNLPNDLKEDHVIIGSSAGVGMSGAVGAVDRLTHEILLSLEERKTLVVWMFDQSGSLLTQRQEIHDCFDRIYDELKVIEAAGHKSFAKYENKPLLSSVIAFGHRVTLRTKEPTDDLDEIKSAVKGIEQDDSGVERVFEAIHQAAGRYAQYRQPEKPGGPPQRNVLLIVFTDEAGDDKIKLEPTIQQCRKLAVPVYVVGVPAVFGTRESHVKWVDPDPTYDQTPQWGRVNQGPESLLPERLHLPFSGYNEDEEPLDAGFGSFHLTRLCNETGGIYFAVHPNRTLDGPVSREQTAAYSAHIRRFFDPRVMRRYKPDYVSSQEYKRRLDTFPTRFALVKAAHVSWEAVLEEPRMKFVRKSEDSLRKEFMEAVEQITRIAARIETIYQVLTGAEATRDQESMPRWQAGYDLAMGQALAAKVRCDGYRILLANMANGEVIKDLKNNHFEIIAASEIADVPQLVEMAERSRLYLNRVIEDHPDTPWAYVAGRELDKWLGWELREWYADMTQPAPTNRGTDSRDSRRESGFGGGASADRRDSRPAGSPSLPPKPERKPPRL